VITKLSALLIPGALVLGCGDSGEKAPATAPTIAPAEIIMPPKVDEPARGGTVQDGDGNAVELANTWGSNLGVIVFYRGPW